MYGTGLQRTALERKVGDWIGKERKGKVLYKQVEFKIRGIAPTIMHSGRLANPLDLIAKEFKRFSSKKKKTDDDFRTMADLEWIGSLYCSEQGEFGVTGNAVSIVGFGKPIWPAENIESMLAAAARKKRLGEQFKIGVMIETDAPLLYSGPQSVEELFADARFRDTRSVTVGMATVMRTRPIFRDWTLKFTASYLPDVVNEHEVKEAVETAGVMVGLSDYRPKFGRFIVENGNGHK